MSYHPLDPETTIDAFNLVSLTGFEDIKTGIYLDADSVNSSVLIQTDATPTLYIDKFQNIGINTLSPLASLDINSINNTHIRLVHNSTDTTARINLNSDGKLIFLTSGSEISIDQTNSFNVAGHNGIDKGLMLAGSLLLASADHLNFNIVTPGTAEASKTLVLDSNRSITEINSLSATNITGTIQTAHQPNITSVNTLNIANHDGVNGGLRLGGVLLEATAEQINSIFGGSGGNGGGGQGTFNSLTINNMLTLDGHNGIDNGLKLGDTLVTASANELNYLTGVQPGTALENKAVVLNSQKNISGLGTVSARSVVLPTGQLTYDINNLRLVKSGNQMTAQFRGTVGYSEDLNVAIIGGHPGGNTHRDRIIYMRDSLEFQLEIILPSYPDHTGPCGIHWNKQRGQFIIFMTENTSSEHWSPTSLRYYTSSNGLSWSTPTSVPNSSLFHKGTSIEFHPLSGHYIHACRNRFNFCSNINSWSSIILPNTSISVGEEISNDGLVFVGRYVIINRSTSINSQHTRRHVMEWTGTEWVIADNVTLPELTPSGQPHFIRFAYHEDEDRLYLIPPTNHSNSTPQNMTIMVVNNASTLTVAQWHQAANYEIIVIPNVQRYNSPNVRFIKDYGIIVLSNIGSTWESVSLLQLNNKTVTYSFSDSLALNPTNAYRFNVPYPFFKGMGSSLIIPASHSGQTLNNPNNVRMLVSTPTGALAALTIGNFSITQSDAFSISNLSKGFVSAGKAIITDDSNNIGGISSLGANSISINGISNLLGETRMSGQAILTNGINVNNGIFTISGTTSTFTSNVSMTGNATINNNLIVGTGINTATISGSELIVLDNAIIGNASTNKALIADNNLSISGLINTNSFAYNGTRLALTTSAGSSSILSTWSRISLSGTSSILSVAYSAPLNCWVAAVYNHGQNNICFQSTDGNTWSQRSLPVSDAWGSVVWMSHNSTFLMTGRLQGRVLTSTDGITWTQRGNHTLSSPHRGCYIPTYGVFITQTHVHNGSAGSTPIGFTADGITWNYLSMTAGSYNSWLTRPIFVRDRLYILPRGEVNHYYYHSDPPNTFAGYNASFIIPFTITGNCIAMAYSPQLNRLVALCGTTSNSEVAYKDDPTPANISTGWIVATMTRRSNWQSCIWSSQLNSFFAISNTNPSEIITSTDGITWTHDSTYQSQAINGGLDIQIGGNVVVSAVTVGDSGSSNCMSVQRYTVIPSGNPSIQIGSTTISEAEMTQIDGITPGTVQASKAVVVDSFKDISSFRNLTSVTLTSTGGDLTMGETNINEEDIAVIDNVVKGIAAADKALIIDSNRDINNINSLSTSTITSTSGTLVMANTTINEAEISVLDGVVPGTVEATKAVIVDVDKNVAGINNVIAASFTSTDGSLTMGTTIINESEIATIDNVTPGQVSPSKAVVVDENKDITSFGNLTAVNLYGTIKTVAQPDITSLGTLDSLAVSGSVSTMTSYVIGSTTITETNAAHLVNATLGTATASHAIITDVNNNIAGINSLSASQLTGTVQTENQPLIKLVKELDIEDHNGSNKGLKLGGVLLTATANQINSIFGDGGEGTFNNLRVNDILTIVNHNGSNKGLKLGDTLVTSTGAELNYVDTTPGIAQPSRALIFDQNIAITGIHSINASQITGTLQTEDQPILKTVKELDIQDHNGTNKGLKLGGVLLTATANQINSIFGPGGEGTFNNLVINQKLTIGNPSGANSGIYLGATQLTSSGIELNYLDGSTPGQATANNAIVLDSNRSINNINSLIASNLTGEIQTASQPNITSIGTLLSLAVAGDVTIGATIISESEIAVIDEVVPGTVSESKAVVVNSHKDISSFRNLTAVNLYGTIKTAAQPEITSVGSLESLNVVGDVNIGGNLDVGGTVISQSEILVLDAAVPGTASANKAMVTDSNNSISGINVLSGSHLVGQIQTADQPLITSVGSLVSLDVVGDVSIGGNLAVGGTFISQSEIIVLDAATPGTASANKAMVTDSNNSIGGINVFSATQLVGQIQTSSQPHIASVNVLNVTSHDGVLVGLSLGGTLVTASASELNYVDTRPGEAEASKALILDTNRNITNINNISISGLNAVTGIFSSDNQSVSTSTGAITTNGGVGIAKNLNVGGTLTIVGNSTMTGKVSITNEDDTTSVSTGSIVTNGGIGISKSLYVGGNANFLGNVQLTGSLTQSGLVVVTDTTDSNSPSTGSITTLGGIGIAQSISIGENATIGGNMSINGTAAVNGAVTMTNITNSTLPSNGAIVIHGGLGIAKNLNVGEDGCIYGSFEVKGGTTQAGVFNSINVTNSTSISTGSITTVGGVGIAKSIHVGESAFVTGNLSISGNSTFTGVVAIDDTTDAVSSTNGGSFTITGGAAIAKKLYVGDGIYGLIQSGNQPHIESVTTLDITAHDGTQGLKLSGQLLASSSTELNYLAGSLPGTAVAEKAIVLDNNRDVTNINTLSMAKIAVGTPSGSQLPLEVGTVQFQFSGAYAFSNSANAHSRIRAGQGVTTAYSARMDGRLLCTGEVQITSDRRMKKNITKLTSDLSKKFIMTTTPVSFNWRTDDQQRDYGYIAQDVLRAGFEDLVTVTPDFTMKGSVEEDGFINPDGAKFVFSPGKIIPMLALNQREVFTELEKKDQKIADLESRIAKLEDIIKKLMQ